MSLPRVADPLRRLDSNPIRHAADSVVACVVLRNEVSRIPHLLDHHRRLGVRRFFIVDNGSEDGSIEVLLDQPDVHLWSTSGSFREANYGAHWFEAILREHAPDNWVVIVDADELLWFDECETRSIDGLCAELEGAGHRAAPGVLLDLYPQGPLAEAQPSTDRSPLETSRWFDRRWYHGISDRSGPHQDQIGVFGGVRRGLLPQQGPTAAFRARCGARRWPALDGTSARRGSCRRPPLQARCPTRRPGVDRTRAGRTGDPLAGVPRVCRVPRAPSAAGRLRPCGIDRVHRKCRSAGAGDHRPDRGPGSVPYPRPGTDDTGRRASRLGRCPTGDRAPRTRCSDRTHRCRPAVATGRDAPGRRRRRCRGSLVR